MFVIPLPSRNSIRHSDSKFHAQHFYWHVLLICYIPIGTYVYSTFILPSYFRNKPIAIWLRSSNRYSEHSYQVLSQLKPFKFIFRICLPPSLSLSRFDKSKRKRIKKTVLCFNCVEIIFIQWKLYGFDGSHEFFTMDLTCEADDDANDANDDDEWYEFHIFFLTQLTF